MLFELQLLKGKEMKLVEKLNKIQVELNAPKNLYNSFGKYNYRNLEGIFMGLKPLLKDTGLVVYVSDEMVDVGGRIYVKATPSVSDGIDTISVNAYAREDDSKKGMDASMLTGATSSYARKYAMNGLFAIDDTVDADGMDNSSNKTPTKQSNAKASQSSDDDW
jgi:hypothetical protein